MPYDPSSLDWQQSTEQPQPDKRRRWWARANFGLTYPVPFQSGRVLVTQEPVEVITGSPGNVVNTQAPVEVITPSPAPGYRLDWVQRTNQPYPYRRTLSAALQPDGVLPPTQPPAIAKLTQYPVEVLSPSPSPGWEMDWVQPTYLPYPYSRVLPLACQSQMWPLPLPGTFVNLTQMAIEIIAGYQYNPYVGWLGTSMSVSLG